MYKVEEWESNQGEKETHYFSPNDQTYFFGYNPGVIPFALVLPILRYIENNEL